MKFYYNEFFPKLWIAILISIIVLAGLIIYAASCGSTHPMKVEVIEDVEYPFEISIISNTEKMNNEEFVEYVYAYLKESKFWQSKVIAEVMFKERKQLSGDKYFYQAYVFWRNK